MSFKIICGLMLFLWNTPAFSQQLIVHVVDQNSEQPMADATVWLHYGCMHSGRPRVVKEKTNAAGVAVFTSVSFRPLEFCVQPDSDRYSSTGHLPYLFVAPENASICPKCLNRMFTSLPNEITFHVRRLTAAQRFRNLFRWD